jgi:hypothetical protein
MSYSYSSVLSNRYVESNKPNKILTNMAIWNVGKIYEWDTYMYMAGIHCRIRRIIALHFQDINGQRYQLSYRFHMHIKKVSKWISWPRHTHVHSSSRTTTISNTPTIKVDRSLARTLAKDPFLYILGDNDRKRNHQEISGSKGKTLGGGGVV